MASAQTQQLDMAQLQASWVAFNAMAHLNPLSSAADYEHAVALMNKLLDEVGEDDDHPMAGLLLLVSEMVSRYEREHYPIEPAEPKEVLRFLLAARGLRQEDLQGIVPQSNLSAILTGKRKISATLAGKLGKFFDVSPAVFVPAG